MLFPFLSIAIAQDPNTKPETLRKLAKHKRQQIRQAVTQNPNTPPETLLELAEEFPAELLQNPVFPLLLLSEPNLLQITPRAALASILKLDHIPAAYLEQATSHCIDLSVARVIAQHPNASQLALEQIAEWAGNLEVGQTLLERCGSSPVLLERLAMHGHRLIRYELAQRTDTPIHILELMAQRVNVWEVKLGQALLERCGSSPTILEMLAIRGPKLVQYELAQRTDTPIHILKLLAQRASKQVMRLLLERSDLSQDFKNYVLLHSYPDVVADYIQKFGVSDEILLRLAHSTGFGQKLLIDLAKLPEKVLEKLARRGNPKMLVNLAQRPDLSESALEILRQRNNLDVMLHLRERGLSALTLEDLAEQGSKRIQLEIAQRYSHSFDLLDRLVEHGHRRARKHLAIERYTPVELLEKLAVDTLPAVRCLVALNPNTPLNLLRQLATDSHPEVSQAALRKLQERGA